MTIELRQLNPKDMITVDYVNKSGKTERANVKLIHYIASISMTHEIWLVEFIDEAKTQDSVIIDKRVPSPDYKPTTRKLDND